MTEQADTFFSIFGFHRVEYEGMVRGILRGGTLEDNGFIFVYHDGHGRQTIAASKVDGLKKLEEK